MEIVTQKTILAVVTTSREHVSGGGCPVFIAADAKDIQRKIFLLENILDGMAHEIDAHTYVVVRH
jgi:hypothetical protein